MTRLCMECKYYRQHYIKRGKGYDKLYYGHCVFPRLKKREAGEAACEHFEEEKYK